MSGGWTVLISSKEPGCDALVEILKATGVDAQRHHLDLCDVAFVKEGRTWVQAEIKKHPDLLASIGRDYRYQEQAASISESTVPYSFYIIEGMAHPPGTTTTDQLKIEHATTRLQLSGPLGQVEGPMSTKRSHIAVVPICSPDGLVEWIKYVLKNLVEDPALSDGVFAPLSANVKHTYGCKPAQRDQGRVFHEQLTRITGVSDTKASVIAQAFPTMTRLLEFLSNAPSEAVIVQHFKGLNTGLGPKIAEVMYCQLLAADERKFEWPVKATSTKKRARTPSAPPGVIATM